MEKKGKTIGEFRLDLFETNSEDVKELLEYIIQEIYEMDIFSIERKKKLIKKLEDITDDYFARDFESWKEASAKIERKKK